MGWSIRSRIRDFKSFLDGEHLTGYIGFDPTADSLHVGHLQQLCLLRRLQTGGHQPIAVAGGGTAVVGDPGGKTEERSLLEDDQIKKNLDGIRPQMERFFDFRRRRAIPGAARGQRRLAQADRRPRVPPRRGQALHGQPDGDEGVGQGATRTARSRHLLHRVHVHAAPGVRLPPPVRHFRLQAPARRKRPVGQHHHGHRADPQGPARARPTVSPRPSSFSPTGQSSARPSQEPSGSTRTGRLLTSSSSSS